MAAIDLLRAAIQDARAAGMLDLPASEDACFPAAEGLVALDQRVLLVLALRALKEVYQAQQQMIQRVQANTADIAAIKQKLGLA